MCVNNVIQSRGALGGLLSGCYWALSLHTDTRGDIAAHHRSRQGPPQSDVIQDGRQDGQPRCASGITGLENNFIHHT